MLAYGLPPDARNESTAIESMKIFCRAMVSILSQQYLCSPTPNDAARILYIGEKRGFSGMLGSLDCMHWKWKIVLLHGQENLQGIVDHQL